MMLVGIHDCSPCWVQIHNQSSSLLPLSQGPDKFISKTGFTTADSGDVSHTFLRWNLRTVYLKARESFSLIVLSTLAWKIPWTEEPVRLQCMGSLRVRHDWMTSLSLFTFMHWRRKWQPTPVFLPGKYQGQASLVGSCLWGCIDSDMTEAT